MTTTLQYRGAFLNLADLHANEQPAVHHRGQYRGATFDIAEATHKATGKKAQISYRGARGEVTL